MVSSSPTWLFGEAECQSLGPFFGENLQIQLFSHQHPTTLAACIIYSLFCHFSTSSQILPVALPLMFGQIGPNHCENANFFCASPIFRYPQYLLKSRFIIDFLFVCCNIQSEKSHKSQKRDKIPKSCCTEKTLCSKQIFWRVFFNNSANHDGAELSSYMSQHPHGGGGLLRTGVAVVRFCFLTPDTDT